LQDFKKIKKFTPFIGNKMFENNVNFIKNEVEKHDKYIIITHHAPSYLCIPGCFDGDDLNSCFASKLDYLFEHKNMLGWIFGHTHHNIDIKMNEKFLYSNCYRGLFK
jgi:hypothetical protein